MSTELINILAAVIALIAAYLARRALNRAEGYHTKLDEVMRQMEYLSGQLDKERAYRRKSKKKKGRPPGDPSEA